MSVKRCFYEVLGITKDATDSQVKKAYRALALQWHPDKHPEESRAEAEQVFQEIVAAYEVLSDSQERAYYDSHRDQILRGGASGGGGDAEDFEMEDLNLGQFTSGSAWDSFDEDDTFDPSQPHIPASKSSGKKSFYEAVSALLAKLERLEDAADAEAGLKRQQRPQFGRSMYWFLHRSSDSASLSSSSSSSVHSLPGFSDMARHVTQFYSYWTGFSSRRSFSFADKWDLREVCHMLREFQFLFAHRFLHEGTVSMVSTPDGKGELERARKCTESVLDANSCSDCSDSEFR